MKNRFLFIILGLVFLVFLVFFALAKTDWTSLFLDVHCSEKKMMNDYEFNGVLLQKFNDYANHNYKAILVKDFTLNKELKLYFVNEKSDFYNLVNTKDTLLKTRNSLVIVDISQKREFKLLYDCE